MAALRRMEGAIRIDRRLLLAGATLGVGALAIPAWAQAVVAARGFTHDVASGEPGPDRVLLWTRYVPAPGQTGRLRWEVARDAGFAAVVAQGEATAGPERDWCVKPWAAGLAPGAWYFYRFVDDAGQASPVGRTRTLPDGPVERFTLGVFSCANLPFGHFNAYGHAAARRDIDLMLHLGDYFYEYPTGVYPTVEQALPGRLIEPAHETVALADYRLRYAAYRLDPDLRRLHRQYPLIAMWDDHESANDAWLDGAQNHDPANEGTWRVRKAAAAQAFREWLPVADDDWAVYRIGQLADLFRLETRLHARSVPLSQATFLRATDERDRAQAEWQADGRTLLGGDQEQWLFAGLRGSVADGVRWQVLGQQVIMGALSLAPDGAALLGQADGAAARATLPLNFDQWDGFPAARDRLLAAALEADANLVVLAGDSHNAWAFELDRGGAPAGTEFAVQSVTSPGVESRAPHDPAAYARAMVAHNRQLHWAETGRRGYLTLELTPARATGTWHFLDTVREPSLALAGTHALEVAHGSRRFTG